MERIPAGETPGPLGKAATRRYPVRRDPRTAHDLGCDTPEQIRRREEAKARRDAARAARRHAPKRHAPKGVPKDARPRPKGAMPRNEP